MSRQIFNYFLILYSDYFQVCIILMRYYCCYFDCYIFFIFSIVISNQVCTYYFIYLKKIKKNPSGLIGMSVIIYIYINDIDRDSQHCKEEKPDLHGIAFISFYV